MFLSPNKALLYYSCLLYTSPTGDVSIVDSIEPDDDLVSGIDDSPKSEIEALEEQIRKNMEENSTDIIYDEDVYNVLLIGSDTRAVSYTHLDVYKRQ